VGKRILPEGAKKASGSLWSKVEDLKKLYRIIAGDERNTAVLKPGAH
jgi:hypothetical protein